MNLRFAGKKGFWKDSRTLFDYCQVVGKDINPAILAEAQKLTQWLMVAPPKVIFENYPDLQVADLYKGWMKEMVKAESNISAAVPIFNVNAENFNNILNTDGFSEQLREWDVQ